MSKRKFLKVILVLTCIMTMIMPYTSNVFAAIDMTATSTTAILTVMPTHLGGEESSKTLNADQAAIYDKNDYTYQVRNSETYANKVKENYTTVYKIVEMLNGTVNTDNMLYCLDETKKFPAVTASGDQLTYKNLGTLKDSTKNYVQALHMSADYSKDSTTWTKNYNALVWLANNVYISNQTPEQKDSYLEKAFADFTPSAAFKTVMGDDKLGTIKAFLTDDDIEVVQQYAMWNFTNNDSEAFDFSDIDINLKYLDLDGSSKEGSYYDMTGYNYRDELTSYLYKYLIKAAANATETEVTYPEIVNQDANCTEKSGYFVVGPFKVKSGTASSSDYTLKLYDQNNKELTTADYGIMVEGESSQSTKSINEIFDVNYYIYIPTTNKSVSKVTLKLSYSAYQTDATVWENSEVDTDGNLVYQPVLLLNRNKKDNGDQKSVEIVRKNTDLALRKFIVSSNNGKKTTTYDMAPVVDVTNLKNGTSTTATYKQSKAPVEVSNGDTIIYEIRVYNEGDIDATDTVVMDAVPTGLEFIEDSEVNTKYKWTKDSTGTNTTVYSSNYLNGTTIKAFDKTTGTELDYKTLQIELKVSDSALAASILTNVAEIKSETITGVEDSTPSNNDYTTKDLDTSDYKGNNDNKSDLTDSNYYYKGREDDDDFAKIKIKGKSFDLALKKFVSKVNGTAPATNREPVVDVTALKNGGEDASYTEVKSPLKVSVGDVVTYTIRVYNEGETSGYAEEVSDYLPSGLGFLVGYTDNVNNYWQIPTDAKTVKLNTITNGLKNLTKDQFTNVTTLGDVDVVVGSAKLTSTKLKSNDTDTKNLITGFDTTNGTTLAYKDIQVTCIVLSEDISSVTFKNIAEVTKNTDENKKEVTDRDSTPGTVDPSNYPASEKKSDSTYQDDNDYENLTVDNKVFDLALQKFITSVNSNKVTDREPKVTVDNSGNITITPGSTNAVSVENNDLVTYTIRVYNEGDIAGYASEIKDSIPTGLVYVSDNDTNKKYGWKMYDSNGKETTDVSSAVSVKTDYLSKEKSDARNEDKALIAAYDSVSKTVSYVDVQLVFKVSEPAIRSVSDRTATNVAEISKDQDQNGNEIDDKDSTPGNNKSGEDDQDTEKIYVKYFDLSLQKDLSKIIVIEDGVTREISANSSSLQKVEIHRKKVNTTIVKFVYKITVKNEGEIAGYATEITDYVPDGLTFKAEDNSNWTAKTSNTITTNALASTLLQPGATASVDVTLRWVNGSENFGIKTNVAEISADSNPSGTSDIDSTPNNKVASEDDQDDAPVMLSVSTGSAPTYLGLTFTVLAILTTGVVLIKKYVLR